MKNKHGMLSLAAGLALLVGTSGCCTIAHQSGTTRDGQAKAPSCDRTPPGTCPWIVGDALLLIPGIIPGVIAFIVDFSNGEWNHG